jgi:hypothetical protein
MFIEIRVGVGLNKVNTDMLMYCDDNPSELVYGYNMSVYFASTLKGHKDNKIIKLFLEKEEQLKSKFENSFKEESDIWEKIFKDKKYLKTKINIYDSAFEAFTEKGLDEWLTEEFDSLFLDIYNEAKN